MGERAVMVALVVKKVMPARPEEHIPPDSQHGNMLWSLLTRCLAQEPGDRPSAADTLEIVSPSVRHRLTSHIDVFKL
jgi:hypothetical protein